VGLRTVACVFKPGNGFTESYVYRLRDGVKQHCKAPHRFVCLTNEQLSGVDTAPLLRGRTGWWNKLELFRARLFDGPVAYFDLDTMIVDDITDIVTRDSRFLGLSDFSPKRSRQFASGFMAWDGRLDFSFLDENFTQFDVDTYSQSYDRWGDQAYIGERVGAIELTNDVFPGRFVSYKWHVRRPGKVPAGASVVCFHGKPRPADVGWRLP
jgi:hypothetical protein